MDDTFLRGYMGYGKYVFLSTIPTRTFRLGSRSALAATAIAYCYTWQTRQYARLTAIATDDNTLIFCVLVSYFPTP